MVSVLMRKVVRQHRGDVLGARLPWGPARPNHARLTCRLLPELSRGFRVFLVRPCSLRVPVVLVSRVVPHRTDFDARPLRLVGGPGPRGICVRREAARRKFRADNRRRIPWSNRESVPTTGGNQPCRRLRLVFGGANFVESTFAFGVAMRAASCFRTMLEWCTMQKFPTSRAAKGHAALLCSELGASY